MGANYKLLFLILSIINISSGQETLEYYKKLINDGLQSAQNYQLHTDARMYHGDNVDMVKEYGRYDFVIIGGGTSGSVVASRLSEMNFQVLLLEAGYFSNDTFEQFLRFAKPFHMYSDLNWGYKTVPQKTGCLGLINESCLVPRGKGVGGNTLINDAIYSRGHPQNFNLWSKITEDVSWSYPKILQYFKKSENFHSTNEKAEAMLSYHGTEGELNVQHRVPDFYLTDTFLEANKELGYDITDMNRPNQIGPSIYQYYSTKEGRREDFGTVFLKPNLDKPNLKVLTGSYVTNIVVNKQTKRAHSVIFTYSGSTYRVKTDIEIILSAGVISTPQILMLSGIGPKKHLQDMGIDLIQDLNVGSTLRDQPFVDLRFSSNVKIPAESLDDQIKDYLKGVGTLTAPTVNQGVGFYNINTPPGKKPNLEVFSDIIEYSDVEKKLMGYKPEIYDALWGSNNTHISFVIENILPNSAGTVRLKSNNPYEYPLIDLNLLSDPNDTDIEVLYQGIQLILSMSETQAYQKLDLKYLSKPLPPCKSFEFRSKEYWYCFIRQTAQTAFHPVGTCPMGASKENGAVVDSKLKVFGIDGLRVIDASVFPTQVSGHPDVAALMIAEKMSDVLKFEYFSKIPDEEVTSS